MPFPVRDNRGGNWFWLHNIIPDHYGPKVGAYGIAIYTKPRHAMLALPRSR